MDLDEFIKEIDGGYEKLMKAAAKDGIGESEQACHVIIAGVTSLFYDFAQAIKTENRRLLECMPCSCKINGDSFGEYLFKCNRCKALEVDSE